ncbi:MAG: hypothetical protein EWV53_10790 [Microcystis panniformis Mp_MB_F_20051200_S9]|uniref:Uncharacterized protein n=1 Tax=Microcystis panniformis Mp_MB_F_20051200_S9 TaxID=2486223 RepID=A0A552PZ11_9CHRO|nr:MAG: hypothetical protein EWV53_10790 [Microcystis panniformis Mp_MB_F_20051200_S9]
MNPLVNYFRNLQEIHSSQAAVKETSYYGTLETLLNEIGKTNRSDLGVRLRREERSGRPSQPWSEKTAS